MYEGFSSRPVRAGWVTKGENIRWMWQGNSLSLASPEPEEGNTRYQGNTKKAGRESFWVRNLEGQSRRKELVGG